MQSRSILSRDRGDFSGAERLRLTKRVTHVGGPDNALGHEQNSKLLSLAGPRGNGVRGLARESPLWEYWSRRIDARFRAPWHDQAYGVADGPTSMC